MSGMTQREQRQSVRRVVRYIPIEEGAEVELANCGLRESSGYHHVLGYQPAPSAIRGRRVNVPTGWIVVLVNENPDLSIVRPRRVRHRRNSVGTVVEMRGEATA